MTPGDLPDWGQVRLPDERRLPSTKQLVTSNRKSSAKDGKGWSKASPNGPLPWLHRIHKPSAGITASPPVTVLCNATTATWPSRGPSLVARSPIPCVLLSFVVSPQGSGAGRSAQPPPG